MTRHHVMHYSLWINTLRWNKMAAILQTIFSNEFSWMKIYEFRLQFHWSLFLRVQLKTFHHWFRWWLGADQATSHYLKQWWSDYRRIYASLGRNDLNKKNGKRNQFHVEKLHSSYPSSIHIFQYSSYQKWNILWTLLFFGNPFVKNMLGSFIFSWMFGMLSCGISLLPMFDISIQSSHGLEMCVCVCGPGKATGHSLHFDNDDMSSIFFAISCVIITFAI